MMMQQLHRHQGQLSSEKNDDLLTISRGYISMPADILWEEI